MTSIEIAKTIFNPPEYERWKKNFNKSRRCYKYNPYCFTTTFYTYITPEGSKYWSDLFYSFSEEIQSMWEEARNDASRVR